MAQSTTIRRSTRLAGGEWNPLKVVFRLFTSVRFAIVTVLLVAVAALLGVIFPQAPDPVRLNPAAYDTWMEVQRGRYHIFAEPMRRLGLFEVFHSTWFNGLFIVLLIAVAVCTCNRFAPTWRTVRRPQRQVNDRYFEHAHARAVVDRPADVTGIERLLRAKRYKVERVADRDGATYLFADRFAFAQLATFVTHLSLILFMAGGIISKLVGFQTFFEVAEGSTAPVFPVLHPNQMQVQNLRSVEGRDAQGNIVDYHTDLVIYKDGHEICRGKTSVNNPLPCNGYRFHQSTFTGDAVALRIRDTRTGAVVYNEAPVLRTDQASPSPRLVITDSAGAILYDDYLVLSPLDDTKSLTLVAVDSIQKLLPVVVFQEPGSNVWKLSVIHARDPNDANDADYKVTLDQGGQAQAGGLRFSFPDIKGLPSLLIQGIPGIDPVALMQLVTERDGSLTLDIQNPAHPDAPAARLPLQPGQPVKAGDYEYTFEGPRAYTGLLVKRDPGSWFIWMATACLIGGLAVTFYLPRRRLWVKITPERTYLAGIAERTAPLGKELENLLASAAAIRDTDQGSHHH